MIDFLDLAKTRGAEITCFNFAHATNEEIKEVIRLCPNLTSLKVRSDKVDHKGLSDLGLLTKLEVLDLSSCQVGNAVLAQVGLLTQLKDLTLQECHEITEEGYAEIAHLTSLQRLDLSGCGGNLTDECVVYLRGLIEMKILNLNHCNVSDVGLKYLSHLPLEELYLRCEITDDGLKHVGKMGSLRVLELSGNLQGPGFIHIQKLGELRMLHVHSYWLEDIALEHIAELPTLEELHVTNNHRITSDGIEKLNQLLTLKRLNLGHCIRCRAP